MSIQNISILLLWSFFLLTQFSCKCGISGDDNDIPNRRSGQVVDGLELKIELNKKTYSPNEPIEIDCLFSNMKRERFDVVLYSYDNCVKAEGCLKFVVKFENGSNVEHRPVYRTRPPNIIRIPLLKNFFLGFSMNLLKYYDLSNPGIYEIILRYEPDEMDYDRTLIGKRKPDNFRWLNKISSNSIKIQLIGR